MLTLPGFWERLSRQACSETMIPVSDYRCADCPTQVTIGPAEFRSLEVIAQVAALLCTSCWRAKQPKSVRHFT